MICLLASLSFSALGLLIASRARTIEAVSGLMNLLQVPMWIVSGVFFSSQRFPDAVQPLIKLLPLTAIIDALRAHMLQGATLVQVAPQLATLTGWLVELITGYWLLVTRRRLLAVSRWPLAAGRWRVVAVSLLPLVAASLYLASRTLSYHANATTPEAFFDLRPPITRVLSSEFRVPSSELGDSSVSQSLSLRSPVSGLPPLHLPPPIYLSGRQHRPHYLHPEQQPARHPPARHPRNGDDHRYSGCAGGV